MAGAIKNLRVYRFLPITCLCLSREPGTESESKRSLIRQSFGSQKKKLDLTNLKINISDPDKHPLPILTFVKKSAGGSLETERCEVDVEAFNSVLDKVGDRPFVILSINGRKRYGKSMTLNHLLRYLNLVSTYPIAGSNADKSETSSNESISLKNSGDQQDLYSAFGSGGFAWGNSPKVITKGILLWPDPFVITFVDAADGQRKQFCLILMDTQGLFDQETTDQENAILYSFATFCSSLMIYNTSNMDDDTLQKVKLYADYAKSLLSDGMTNSQKFIFLYRDFPYFEFYPGGLHNDKVPSKIGKNYWLTHFSVSAWNEMGTENVNVRRSILEAFSEVQIFPLPDPGNVYKSDPVKAVTSSDQDYIKHMEQHMIPFMKLVTDPSYLAGATKTVSRKIETGTSFKEYVNFWAQTLKNPKELLRLPTHAEFLTIDMIRGYLEENVKGFQRQVHDYRESVKYGTIPDAFEKELEHLKQPWKTKFEEDCAKIGANVLKDKTISQKFDTKLQRIMDEDRKVNGTLWEQNATSRVMQELPAAATAAVGTTCVAIPIVFKVVGGFALTVGPSPVLLSMGVGFLVVSRVMYGLKILWPKKKLGLLAFSAVDGFLGKTTCGHSILRYLWVRVEYFQNCEKYILNL